MKKSRYEIVFGFTDKIIIRLLSFPGSLSCMVSLPSITTCISLNYQPCMTRPIFIDLIFINIIKDCITIHIWLS